MPGLDGQKMSKSYHNTISLRETPANVDKKNPYHSKPTRRGYVAPTPVIRLNVRYGNSMKSIRMNPLSSGYKRVVVVQGLVVLNANNR